MKWVLGLICGVLLIGNFFWAMLYFHWRTEAQQLREENAHLEIKVESAVHSKEQLTQDVQAAIDSQEVAGIYECKLPYNEEYQKIDLRSDGRGLFDNGYSSGRGSPISWKKVAGNKIDVDRHGQFKLEGMDLIDDRGNRWLHIR